MMLLFVQVAALEREQVEIKDEENERLRLQLQAVNKKLLQQAEDHEVCIYVLVYVLASCKYVHIMVCFVYVCTCGASCLIVCT